MIGLIFFRSDETKRKNAVDAIRHEIQSLGGRIIQECVIGEIFYHGMLVELPRVSIEGLVNRYEEIELSQVDDIQNLLFCKVFYHANLALTLPQPCINLAI